jgi:hypothetical protein
MLYEEEWRSNIVAMQIGYALATRLPRCAAMTCFLASQHQRAKAAWLVI